MAHPVYPSLDSLLSSYEAAGMASSPYPRRAGDVVQLTTYILIVIGTAFVRSLTRHSISLTRAGGSDSRNRINDQSIGVPMEINRQC
jgi:hypothetical protein